MDLTGMADVWVNASTVLLLNMFGEGRVVPGWGWIWQ